MKVEKGYSELAAVLQEALDQAQSGKGKERHAGEGETFLEQPIMEISRRVGPGGPAFQAIKKIQEALGSFRGGFFQRGKADLLGAIVYTAALLLLEDEKHVVLEKMAFLREKSVVYKGEKNDPRK